MSRTKVALITFEQWMADVNLALDSLAGLSADDLPDKLWRDLYDEGLSPDAAATLALEEEGLVAY